MNTLIGTLKQPSKAFWRVFGTVVRVMINKCLRRACERLGAVGALNAERYKEELEMFVSRILEVLPAEIGKTKGLSVGQIIKALAEQFCNGEEAGIDRKVVEAALEQGVRNRKGRGIVQVGKGYAVPCKDS